MNRHLDRRTFLRFLTAAGTMPLTSTLHSAGAQPATPAAGRGRVVVLGAGLAGLAAAYNLINHG